MNTLLASLWAASIMFVAASIVLALLASRVRQPILGAFGVIPVTLGLLAHTFGIVISPPYPVLGALLGLGLFLLAIVGGGPLALFVLGLTERHRVVSGDRGGIPAKDGTKAAKEVLRGGATIGYLERLAVVASVITGNVGGVAVLVAVKGLGRFSELDSPEARERFIIGTLVSLIWAAACAALILLAT